MGARRHGPVEKGYSHVFVIDAVLGGTPRQITERQVTTTAARNGLPTARRFTSRRLRKPDAEYMRGDSEIYAIDLESSQVKALTDRKRAGRRTRVPRRTAS